MGGFSSGLGSLAVTVGAKIDGFEKAMGTVSQRLNAVDREASRAFSGFEKLGDRLTTVGTGLTAAITLPLAGAAIAATKFATDFELGMRQVTSLLGGVTAQEFVSLSKRVLQLSRDMGIDAVKATNALYEAISAGVPKENAIDFIAVASKAAIAGVTDTAVAVDALTTIIAAYNLDFTEATKVSDALFQAVNVGKFTFEEVAKAIGPAAAQAKNLGISYEELLAATSTLSITSGGVSIAVTQIESAMRALLQPTKEMQAALKAVGFETGSAAVETLGFEGLLNKLREQTGGNAEAFNALFGRIEGYNAAIGLTGDRSQQAAKDLDILRNSTGAAERAFQEIDKTTARQFERLTAELKTTAIELGTALLPAVNGLLNAAKPLISVLADVVRWFTMLPEPIQSTIIGVAALAAAVGPLVIVAGQAVTAFAALAPALTSAYGSLTTLAAGSGTATAAVTALQGAAVLTAGAFLGWKLGSWAYEQIPGFKALGDAMAGVLLAVPGVDALINRMVGATAAAKDQEFATAKLEEALRRQGVTVTKEGKTQEEYEKLLGETAKQISGMNDRMRQVTTTTGNLGSATVKAGGQVDKFRQAVDAEKASILDAAEKTKIHDRAMRELGLGTDKATKALEDLVEKVETYNKTVGNARDFKLFDEAIKSAVAASKSTGLFTEELDLLGIAAGSADKKLEHLGDSTLPILTTKTDASILKQRELAEAFKILGVTSAASIQATADNNRRAYETISADANSSLKDVIAAWVKYEESAIEAAQAAGQQVPVEQQASLDRMKAQLDTGTKKQENQWRAFATQVSTIVTDLGRELAAGTVDFFKGIFGLDGFNAGLREQSAALSAELDVRRGAFDDFAAATQQKLEEASAKYAGLVNSETAELVASLEERRREYEIYTQEVAVTQETLRNTEAVRLAEELGTLSDRLRDKESEYERYVGTVAEKEVEIRRSHEEQLANQLEDLRGSLADRVQSYGDFVEDANARLAGVGADVAETTRDAGRSANRKTEDETRRHNRKIEGLNDDLAKALSKGDTERIAQIQKALEQEREDHARTTRRIQEDLAEQVRDAQRRAEEQTASLKTQLDRRARDHAQFLEENTAKQNEATELHATRQAKELADLRKSLAERTEALLKYREETDAALLAAEERGAARLAKEESDLAASLAKRSASLAEYEQATANKIEALTAKYNEQLAKETASLAAAVDERALEWERFRSETVAKMEQLEADLKGPLDRVKELFSAVAESAINAFARLASEAAIGAVIKQLRGPLMDALGAVGAALGSIFGVGSGAAGQVAGTVAGAAGSVGSTATGVAGQAAGAGLTATLGTVFSGIGAAAGIGSFIQGFQMEKGQDAIEENTRRSEIHLEELVNRGQNLFLSELPGIREIVGAFQDHHAWRIHDVWDRLGEIKDVLWIDTNGILTEIRDSIQAPRVAVPFVAASGGGVGTVIVNWNANDPTGFRGLVDNIQRGL